MISVEQYFRWNSPYDDLGAMNVQDGSVDYSDFRWGEPVDPVDEEENVPQTPAAPDKPEEDSVSNPDQESYPVVQA